MRKILVVDDDTQFLFSIKMLLRPNFEMVGVESAKDAIQVAVAEKPDLILLDLHLGDGDGFSVCKRLREIPESRNVPIIFLTGDDNLEHRVKSLNLGADDFLAKPFEAAELLARINARIRRSAAQEENSQGLEIANLKLDILAERAWINGELLDLTRLEFQLLEYFVRRKSQLIRRNELLADIWPNVVVSRRAIDTHIVNLRRKMKNFSGEIETVYGGGYSLNTLKTGTKAE